MKWNVLRWSGMDAVVLDDTTSFGLRRMHVVRFSALPDLSQFYPDAKVTAGADVGYVEFLGDDGYGHLWIWWKPKKEG